MRDVLRGLEMLSEANAGTALDSRSGAAEGKKVSREPRGEQSLHDYWRLRMSSSTSTTELEVRIVKAEEALAAARSRQAVRDESPKAKKWRILHAYPEASNIEIAVHEGVSTEWVRRVKASNP